MADLQFQTFVIFVQGQQLKPLLSLALPGLPCAHVVLWSTRDWAKLRREASPFWGSLPHMSVAVVALNSLPIP